MDDIFQRHASIAQRRFNKRHNQFGVRTRRNLRDDAAKGAVMVLLPRQRVAQNGAVAAHDGGRRFVATRFQTQYYRHCASLRCLPRCRQAA